MELFVYSVTIRTGKHTHTHTMLDAALSALGAWLSQTMERFT